MLVTVVSFSVEMEMQCRYFKITGLLRVEELGGIIEFGCLNGELFVTRALWDWNMKRSSGSASPLIAEPDVHQILLTEDDEFFIMASHGIWDVMGNQEAVGHCTP
ncbi:hypothetical protein RHMOL_Rhmol08G0215300 [Rhododendron molle]|uniref:Uncharacterized protein n=1 Tax=Rhododendron molle TaxID=49168 RepID=A0ACC0MSC2_RHOML|nr:hypothetical protein RHMOL_Rhmol08G0215300 [Rhododendron molle]